jgi:hypothetical protein
MKFFLRALLVFSALISISSYCAGFYGISDPVMGEYEGFWTAKNGAKGRVTAQVRPLSNNQYDGFVLLRRARNPVAVVNLKAGSLENGVLKVSGETSSKEAGGDLMARSEAKCEIRDGKLTGSFSGQLGEGTLEASKIERKPLSLGAKPPKNAIVLFDGKNTTAWDQMNWPITPDGALQVQKGNIRAKEKLANYKLHIEFRTPYMPTATGQARGNSGVYLQGKYEVQVLDSFGLYPLQDNDCGAIYHVQAPQSNACLPPMEWQTYDITYVDGNPAAKESPTITVVQNGMTVINHAKIPAEMVENGNGGGDSQSGFLMLQDHGNPVQFRNIWAQPFFSYEKKHD